MNLPMKLLNLGRCLDSHNELTNVSSIWNCFCPCLYSFYLGFVIINCFM